MQLDPNKKMMYGGNNKEMRFDVEKNLKPAAGLVPLYH